MRTTSPHTVSDLMTRAAVAVGGQASYKDIVTLMHQWKVSALPVLAGDGRVIGVVSEADLLPKEENRPTAGSAPGDRPFADASKADALYAEQLMSSPAVTVHADATAAEAARIMARRRVKRLPVVDSGGVLRGIISRGDLLKVFLRSDDDIAAEARTVLSGLPAASGLDVRVSDGVVTLGALCRTGHWSRSSPVRCGRWRASWTSAWTWARRRTPTSGRDPCKSCDPCKSVACTLLKTHDRAGGQREGQRGTVITGHSARCRSPWTTEPSRMPV